MTNEHMQKCFPAYIPEEEIIIAGAKENEYNVYRICKWGELNQHAFISTYEEVLERDGNVNDLDLNDISSFSTSCFEKEKDAKRMMKFFTKKNPQAILAYGNIKKETGLSQKTSERKPKQKSHVDWWIYKDSIIYSDFKKVTLERSEENGE